MTRPAGSARDLQVLLRVGGPRPLIAGLPAQVRAARAFRSQGLRAVRILLSPLDRSFIAAWGERLDDLPWLPAAGEGPAILRSGLLDPEAPLLELPEGSLPDEEALGAFLRSAEAADIPSFAMGGGAALAAYYPRAALYQGIDSDAEGFNRVPIEAGFWERILSPEDASRAQERLYRSLPRESDGYLARFDRRLSIAISKRLLRFPLTPNHITMLGLGTGLLGAALLAQPSYPLSALGAVLLWTCCILDGCDGEISRLKLLDSPRGARFDALADNAVHLAVFIAVAVHVQRAQPGTDMLRPALALLAGFLLSAFWVWRLILNAPGRTPLQRVFERIASRDFLYLVLLLALARKLEWFLWAAAVGSHLFWTILVLAARLASSPRDTRGEA